MMVLVMKFVKFVNWIAIVVALEIAFVIQINIGIKKKEKIINIEKKNLSKKTFCLF